MPQEFEHERRRRMIVDVRGRADLLDPAVVHDHDAVRDFERLFLVVRHEHARHVDLVVQAAQPAAQFLADARVERAERLVQQQHARLDRQRARQRDALPLAAGELVRVAVGQPVELHELEQRVHLFRNVLLGQPVACAGRTRKPKATFSKMVMCPNSA